MQSLITFNKTIQYIDERCEIKLFLAYIHGADQARFVIYETVNPEKRQDGKKRLDKEENKEQGQPEKKQHN